MRKFFAATMAAAMVMSMGATSFAATSVLDDSSFTYVYKYSSDDKVMKNMNGKDAMSEYGKAAYIQLVEGGKGITDYDQVEKLKVKAEFEMGEDLVESISVVKKLINPKIEINKTTPTNTKLAGAGTVVDKAGVAAGSASFTYKYEGFDGTGTFSEITTAADWAKVTDLKSGFDAGYYYFVEFKTKKDRVIGDSDIIGTFEFNRKENKKVTPNVARIKDEEHDFAFNLWYENNYNDTTNHLVGSDGVDLKWDDKHVLKFESDDEVEITFGKHTFNEGTFTVDVSGQNKMVIDFNTKANEVIADANPGVKMFFVNFNGAKFNRTGVFEYDMEDLVAAYKVVDNQLVEINGLEIDGETATFSTNTLGNYVFANAELVNPTPAVEAPVVDAAVATNPTTGGN